MSRKLPSAVQDFLAQQHIAVAGVSRDGDQPANTIYRKLREKGYQVFAVNPRATAVEGDPCYATLEELPGPVDALMIATPSEAAPELVRQCVELGIGRVWMHRSVGPGSVSDEAVELCRRHGIAVIPGGCPMMHLEPVDVPHRCMRWVLGFTGHLPQEVIRTIAGG